MDKMHVCGCSEGLPLIRGLFLGSFHCLWWEISPQKKDEAQTAAAWQAKCLEIPPLNGQSRLVLKVAFEISSACNFSASGCQLLGCEHLSEIGHH